MNTTKTIDTRHVAGKLNFHFLIGMLVAIIALLVMVSYGMQVYKFVFHPEFHVFQKLDVDGEKNIPAFFSTFLLVTASAILAFVTYLHNRLSKGWVFYWMGLSGVFLYLALDELISMHELFIEVIQAMAHSDKGIYHLGWVIPMGFFALIFGLIYLRFLGHLPKRTRQLFIASGAVYVFGALGMEIIGSYYYQMTNADSLEFQTCITIEETLEMSGITLFIYALLQHIKQYLSPVTLRLRFTE